MKYFIYARKSSESEDRQILSIDSQIKELKIVAKRLGLDVVEILTESRSAKSPGRPIFTQLMERVYKGEANGILCWKLDRLARNPVDGGSIIWAIKEIGIDIITPAQTFNQANENSILMYIEFGMAQKYVDDLSKNVKRGLMEKAEKGWFPAGAKSGYMNDKYADRGDKTILPDPNSFELIKKAWGLMITGSYSPMEILRKLNDEWGYRTPVRRRMGGKPMSRSRIYVMFTDTFYYGEYEFPANSGKWHKGKHIPMVSKSDFDKVQQLLGDKGRPRPKEHSYKYIGMLKCGECNAAITAEEKWQLICTNCKHKFSSRNTDVCPKCRVKKENMDNPTLLHYIYYHCTKRKIPTCTQKSINEHNLEKQIDLILSRIQISEKFKNWAIKYINELNDQETVDRQSIVKSLQSSYENVLQRIDNLVKLKISPQNTNGLLLSDEEFVSQKNDLVKEKSSLQEKLNDTDDRINKWMELTEKTFDLACYARYWFSEGDSKTKKEILSAIGSNLILKDQIVRINFSEPLNFIEIAKSSSKEISDMFEPDNKAVTEGQMDSLYANNPDMQGYQDSNLEKQFWRLL